MECQNCAHKCHVCDAFYSVEILPEADGWLWYIHKHSSQYGGIYVAHGHAKTITDAGRQAEAYFDAHVTVK